MELKCSFPYRLSSRKGAGEYVYQGSSRVPQAGIPVEHYLQCHLQMLVTNLDRCDLVNYSPKCGTYVFQLRRDDQLCKLMLGILRDMNEAHIKPGIPPKASSRAAVNSSAMHAQFMEAVVRSVRKAEQQRWEIPVSEFNPAQASTFLDSHSGAGPSQQPLVGTLSSEIASQ